MFKYFFIFIPALLLAGCSNQNIQLTADLSNLDNQVQLNQETNKISNMEYNVDLSASKLTWSAQKVLVRTNDHYGQVNLSGGNIKYNNEEFVSAEFMIDMKSIIDQDLSGKSKEMLENHIKSADFFDVENYPEAKLVVTKLEPNPDLADSKTNYVVTGNLTIKGKTNEISFPAIINKTTDQISAQAEFSIDRTLWDIRYGSGKFFKSLGDNVIDDMIGFKVDILANKIDL